MAFKGQIGLMDGNEAVANVAYRVNEVIALYPITPSSNMGEHCDAFSALGMKNIWGVVPSVVEMQSEAGAAGAIHGALQGGALSVTFTASQGLLLMIPNMYKIAGELTPTVFHVSARTVASHALSIFGDHSDVMACRQTGWAMLASASVQEAHDFALIAHAATLEARVPILHYFEGFRVSHEVAKINMLTEDDMRHMIDDDLVGKHRERSLSPDRPVLRGSAQNPDVFFQARETVNPYYDACAGIIQKHMDKFAARTGRQYRLVEYHGAPDADRMIVIMGCGGEAVHEAVDYLNKKGEKVGVLKLRLFRPFDVKTFVSAIPATVKKISVLDRTKEPGAEGEPLYIETITALHEAIDNGVGNLKSMPKVVGGRYGLSSKEFTSSMAKGVLDELKKDKPKNHFTIGINDDVTHTSLTYDANFSTEEDKVRRAMFYGLGSDGTVGANKNSIKIIGENTELHAQGYFVYDSKKAGSVTISHLRFGPEKIRSSYLITQSHFVACHQTVFLEKYDMLKNLLPGGTFLLNTPHGKDQVWDTLPRMVQEQIIAKKAKVYVIDGYKVARDTGMGGRVNTIMQTCFFAISGVLPREEAIEQIKKSIKKTYGRKGDDVVKTNIQAVEQTLDNLHEVKVPSAVTSKLELGASVSEKAPKVVREVLGEIIGTRGDDLPVSAFTKNGIIDGTFPTATAQWEKRSIALEIPVWDSSTCIQCGKCNIVCPHAAIRAKVYDPKHLEKAPKAFKHTEAKDKEWKGLAYTIQVASEDCTGCGACVNICPAKNKAEPSKKAINMHEQASLRAQERANFDFFMSIPDMDRRNIKVHQIRQQQVQRPLFEFSGACAGCGETPYLKLMSQLFGDRTIIANATGCSSIYGGNLPTTPYTVNSEGRGPAWCNSLFEDNAEFGLGIRLSVDQQRDIARDLTKKLASQIGDNLVDAILNADQKDEPAILDQRERVEQLKVKIKTLNTPEAKRLAVVADNLVKRSVWIVGGDGWAYDIGYGGLDHVLASGKNVNILVMDTEVYSNTGGQMSKATPRGAIARFAEGGKPAGKKDLGMMAIAYGNCYVASIAMGANDNQTLKAFLEAEAYNGPSIILAYSHCIAMGLDTRVGMNHQKAAVDAGNWLLYRYNPSLAAEGKNPMQLDSRKPSLPVSEFMMMENRFKQLTKIKPEEAKKLFAEAQHDVDRRWAAYEHLASQKFGTPSEG